MGAVDGFSRGLLGAALVRAAVCARILGWPKVAAAAGGLGNGLGAAVPVLVFFWNTGFIGLGAFVAVAAPHLLSAASVLLRGALFGDPWWLVPVDVRVDDPDPDARTDGPRSFDVRDDEIESLLARRAAATQSFRIETDDDDTSILVDDAGMSKTDDPETTSECGLSPASMSSVRNSMLHT
jgi:hypothetical protein